MQTEKINVKGDVSIRLYDERGNLKDSRDIKNLVVATGLTFIASRMIGTSQGVMTHIGLGSGSTAPTINDTALESLLGTREILDSSTTPATGVILYKSTFEQGDATGAITEAGIFNASSGGTMLCRTTFGTITKGAQDTLAITWQITVA